MNTSSSRKPELPTIPAKSDAEFQAGKRLYAEQWGDAVVTNTYLKITILALSLLCGGSFYIAYATAKKIDSFHTRYIRIDAIGRAEAIKYDDLSYKPQEKEIKYFLTEFCRLYYGRNKLTIRDDVRRALLFMDTQLATNTLAAWTKEKTVDNFLAGTAPNQEVKVNRIDIEDLRAAPYKATVEFELIYRSPLDGSAIKRSQYTAHVVFAFRDTVGNDLIQINPLGLAISYFREDEALN
ncbi:MAG TPA: VirB8/TrbF family protein [Verrucomicrobiae bacterium]|nr:VirB8/TrbF family protein [Verrucomicrobiae bacterium]